MTVRTFLKFSALLCGTATLIFSPGFSSASVASDKKFARDLESVFGASLKTSQGEMTVRQRKDQNGRVRKQIITGKEFGEIQLDQDGDGTVDFLEVTRGVRTVTVSHPNRGRFLRLEIAEKTKKGLKESLYLLSVNGRAYNFVSTRMTGKDVVKRVEDASVEPTFEPSDPSDTTPPLTLSADVVPTSSDVEVRSAGFSAEEEGWMKEQGKTLGDGFMCKPVESGVASLQRDWWKVLKYDVQNQTDVMIQKLKNSTMFDESCKKPANRKDFDAMVNGLAVVMLSSSVGQPLTTDNTRGRFLRCLELSGLGPVSARIEQTFMKSMNPGISPAPIRCDWRKGAAGVANPAELIEGQVSVHICSADITKDSKNKDGSQNNYENILMHEFMHVAVRDGNLKLNDEEALVSAAQACCGNPTDLNRRAPACGKLDGIVVAGIRFKEIETHLMRVNDGLTPLKTELRNSFSPEAANVLYKNLLMGLDKESGGILSNESYSKCVAEKSETVCRAEWTENIRKYADKFFAKDCKQLVVGSERNQCKKVSDSFKSNLATTIASSMLSSCPKAGKPGVCEAVAERKIEKADGLFAGLSDLIFGRSVQAAIDPDCGCEIDVPNPPVQTSPGTPVVDNPNEAPPSVVVTQPNPDSLNPNQGQGIKVVDGGAADRTDGVNQGPDSTVGSGTGGSGGSGGSGGAGGGRRDRDRSPLPVTRVDSPTSGRTVAEDRYRRATDIVGGVSRAALPRAIAGERDGRRSLRLGPQDKFIPFKPEDPREIIVKLDNPFGVQRSVASIGAASASSAQNGSGAQANVGSSSTDGAASRQTATAADGQATALKKGSAAFAARNASGGGGSSSPSTAGSSQVASATLMKVGGLQQERTDILWGLFTMPYRQIEQRLRKLDVVEELIARKISIQDDKGQNLGSNRPVEKFKFNGYDRPLSKQGKR